MNSQSQKHVPVMLQEVLKEFETVNKTGVTAVDCTLGQAGHSAEIYNKIENGVLLSIDLNKASVEYVGETYGFSPASDELLQKTEESKKWILVREDFSEIKEISEKLKLQKFDFLLADLGYSNFELQQNLGISFSNLNQDLDMRYEIKEGTLNASDILNTFSVKEISHIIQTYGDIENSSHIAKSLVQSRSKQEYRKVSDLVFALKKFPDSIKVKVFQALRSFVNKEEERLEKLVKEFPDILSQDATAVIITFNHREEEILKKNLKNLQVKEPNITEIIQNPQSRSAKIYIYKQTRTGS